jgi:hypothetical protein
MLVAPLVITHIVFLSSSDHLTVINIAILILEPVVVSVVKVKRVIVVPKIVKIPDMMLEWSPIVLLPPRAGSEVVNHRRQFRERWFVLGHALESVIVYLFYVFVAADRWSRADRVKSIVH